MSDFSRLSAKEIYIDILTRNKIIVFIGKGSVTSRSTCPCTINGFLKVKHTEIIKRF